MLLTGEIYGIIKTYVMNNVEIVIYYYLYITSHVSHAITSYTLYTNYSLLNLVHEIVYEVWLGHPRLCFLWCLMQNMFKGWQKLCF